jgi:hypothetical protein
MFKLIAVFFLESYLVQLFGVSLPLWHLDLTPITWLEILIH